MKIILIITLCVLCLGLYAFKKPSLDMYLSKIRLRDKFANYPQLGIDRIKSADFELVKMDELNEMEMNREVGFIPTRKTFIFRHTSLSSYSKFSARGDFLGSFGDDANLHSCGVFFHNRYYIDWALTGDTTQKPYKEYIKAANLSKEQFKQYINSADVVAYQTRYLYNPDQMYGRCFLNVQGDWIVIERKLPIDEEGFDLSSDPKRYTMQSFATKNDSAFNIINDATNWRDGANAITIEAFVKTKRFKKPFFKFGYDINNQAPKNGWQGTGYFHWKMGQDTLKFQAYSYKVTEEHWKGHDPDMSIYRQDSLPHLAFLVVGKGEFKRPAEELGLYVLRKIDN